MVEGRDHVAGDSFILVGEGSDRSEDIYVTRDSGPADAPFLDLIAAAHVPPAADRGSPRVPSRSGDRPAPFIVNVNGGAVSGRRSIA